MQVDPAATPHRGAHDGRRYYFCCAGCRRKFIADPEKYRDGAEAKPGAPPGPEGAVYTCPMHPRIRQSGPGTCPICGMALEPEAGGAIHGGELADMSRRLVLSAALALPVVVLDMGAHMFGFA